MSTPHTLRAGFTLKDIFNLAKIDRWFLVQLKKIVAFEEVLAAVKHQRRVAAADCGG